MPEDERNILDVLKFELAFLEQGGYGRSVKTPWRATSMFQDSPSCINFNSPERSHPCAECSLIGFVPAESREEEIPCHHIPLNSNGETVHGMDRQRTRIEMEAEFRKWLLATIERLEEEQERKHPRQTDSRPHGHGSDSPASPRA
jgi:hypothetical protein